MHAAAPTDLPGQARSHGARTPVGRGAPHPHADKTKTDKPARMRDGQLIIHAITCVAQGVVKREAAMLSRVFANDCLLHQYHMATKLLKVWRWGR